MTRSAEQRVADILAAIDTCLEYRDHLDGDDDQFVKMTIDAILRNIEVIGEAVNHLPTSVTDAHPEIDWNAIIGMRNTLIHQYWRTDPEIVNEVLDKDLAPLAAALRSHTAK